jgi:RND family efflux transporter MFP subunit
MRYQALPGTVVPSDQAVIASKLMATVASVEVSIGEPVNMGDLLIVLEAGEIQAQVEQAEASLAQLKRNLERERALLAQNATTAEAVRTLEDEIRVARAQLSEARTMESYMRIRAPFDGVVTSKEVKRGDLASPGVPLMSLEGTGNLEVHVEVPDSLMALPYGAKVTVVDRDKTHEASLSEWSPAADTASRTRLAKLALAGDTALRSGQYVRVNWPAGEEDSIWIPQEAVSSFGQIERAYVLSDARIRMRIIKTGHRRGDRVQILAGLNPGELIVVDPDRTFIDGQPVRELP